MLKGEYDKAEKLAKRFPNYAPIQSQLVTIYIKKWQDEEAFKIADNFKWYEPIQEQLLELYMNQNNFKKAKEIADFMPHSKIIKNKFLSFRNITGGDKLADDDFDR